MNRVVIPIFALANAGVSISGFSPANAASSGVTPDVVAGLVLGKTVGVAALPGWPARRAAPWPVAAPRS